MSTLHKKYLEDTYINVVCMKKNKSARTKFNNSHTCEQKLNVKVSIERGKVGVLTHKIGTLYLKN